MIYCVPPLLNYKVAYTTKLWRPQGQSLVSGAEDGVVLVRSGGVATEMTSLAWRWWRSTV